jgi:hypothetical protein
MNSLFRRQLVFIVTIFLTLLAVDAYGITIGIETTKFNDVYAEQDNSQWCWAASIQMIMNYYGVDITQEDIVRRSFGTDPFGNLPNWGGSLPVITANLNNWSVDNSGHRYTVSSSLNFYAPIPRLLIDEISKKRPVLIGYKNGPTGGHAVVITALSYIITNNGPVITSLVVRDPWPSANNRANGGRVEYQGIQLASLINAHWIISVNKKENKPNIPDIPASQDAISFEDGFRKILQAADNKFSSIKGTSKISDRVFNLNFSIENSNKCSLSESATELKVYCLFDTTNNKPALNYYKAKIKDILGNSWRYQEDKSSLAAVADENSPIIMLDSIKVNNKQNVKLEFMGVNP